MELLHASPLPAGRIAEHFSISRPGVSKHLRILAECGVIEATVQGRQRIYALRREPLVEVADYLGRLLGPGLPARLDALATEVARTRRERRIETAGAATPDSSATASKETA